MVQPGDIAYMKSALVLAARGLGQVAPNPAVGCVIMRDGHIVGRGWTQAGGRPHAETEALARAGEFARGATAYVTLEPCAHHGKTGPCAEALIKAGVSRVVGALMDPDSRVSGRGYEMLSAASVEVTENVCAAEARELNEGFILSVTQNRPLVTLKIASSADGRAATQSGQSRWITGEDARNHGHLLRATHDAILIGSATAIVDDAQLTCRLPGLTSRSPIRIVADGHLRLPLTAKIVRDARQAPVWILTLPDGDKLRREAFIQCGVNLIEVPAGSDGMMDMKRAMALLAGRGVTRLLVEGGARIASSFLRAELVDRVEWFVAPSIIGGDGYPAIAALGVSDISKSLPLRLNGMSHVGKDVHVSYTVRSS
jgi:diaminohydroxyphosphoribosylaminopyrimidine deaminase/5-amino-6-(5-phosphoribosylamino)uracil reductase